MNEKNIRLVTAESVRAGHPDKFCDQVADAILDAHLRLDPNARVAVEVFATAGKIIVGGEITSQAKVDCSRIVAGAINRSGYTMAATLWKIFVKTLMTCWNWKSASTNSPLTSPPP